MQSTEELHEQLFAERSRVSSLEADLAAARARINEQLMTEREWQEQHDARVAELEANAREMADRLQKSVPIPSLWDSRDCEGQSGHGVTVVGKTGVIHACIGNAFDMAMARNLWCEWLESAAADVGKMVEGKP